MVASRGDGVFEEVIVALAKKPGRRDMRGGRAGVTPGMQALGHNAQVAFSRRYTRRHGCRGTGKLQASVVAPSERGRARFGLGRLYAASNPGFT
jgi:hypothetical protein